MTIETNRGEKMQQSPEFDQDRIKTVLAKVPTEQYVDPYTDTKGVKGYRNPVRPVVAETLTAIVDRLKPQAGVELGTALGSSGLRMALGGLRQLDTVEFDAEAAGIAQEHFLEAGLPYVVHNQDSGEFSEQFGEVVDLIFIDHAKERYLGDFQNLEAQLSDDGLLLMDNTFNRAAECADAVAYVADNYFATIFVEPSTGGETTGLLIASKSRETFDAALQAVIDVRAE